MTESMIRKAANGLALNKVTSLSLREHNLERLDVEVMNRMKGLKSLDISDNEIGIIPAGLSLPNLTVLDCSDNNLFNLEFVKKFPRLHTLHVEGNNIELKDLYAAACLCKTLKTINKVSVSYLHNKVGKMKTKFDIQVKAKWEVLFAADYACGIPSDEVTSVKMKFMQSLESDSLFGNADTSFEKMVLDMLATEVVMAAKDHTLYSNATVGTPRSARLHNQKLSRDSTPKSPDSPTSPFSPSRRSARGLVPKKDFSLTDTPTNKPPTPGATWDMTSNTNTPKRGVKRLREETPPSENKQKVKGKTTPQSDFKRRTKVMIMEDRSVLSPKFTSIKKKEELDINQLPPVSDYDPAFFVRCHSKHNSPSDDTEKVWKCAFEPKPHNPDEHTNIVATCGGKIVCLIDCHTGKVMRRFKDTDKKECFYTLAWSTLPVQQNGKTEKTNIIAVGGSSCDVKLIHPTQLVMYAVLEGHARSVFCLTFHPEEPTYLFSGGSDGRIVLWDIGIPDFTDYTTNCSKLMTLQTPNTEPIHLTISVDLNVLLAGCQNGCFAWKLGNFNKISKQPDLDLYLPVMDDDLESVESGDNDIIDGLVAMDNSLIVSKSVGQSCLTIWDLKSCIPEKLPKQRPLPVSVSSVATLKYKKTTVDYIAPGVADGMVVIGDDEGAIHMYNVHKLLSKNKHQQDSLMQESRLLPWPEVSLGRYSDSMQDLENKKGIVINTVAMNSNQEFIVCGTDNNMVCVWRKSDVSQ